MQKEIDRLKSSSEENLRSVVLLTQKASRKRVKISNLRKQIKVMAERLSTCMEGVSSMRSEIQGIEQKSEATLGLFRDKMKELLKAWKDIKLLQTNPTEIAELKMQQEFLKGTAFTIGKTNLADNICKLQTILKEKLEEFKSLEIVKTDGEKQDGKVSEDSKSLYCPHKERAALYEVQLEEYKGRIEVLERKEKFLNKMLNSNVIFNA